MGKIAGFVARMLPPYRIYAWSDGSHDFLRWNFGKYVVERFDDHYERLPTAQALLIAVDEEVYTQTSDAPLSLIQMT